MASLAEIRQQYPQYSDMSDQELADAVHKKFYSDIPKEDFYKRIGFQAASPQAAPPFLDRAGRQLGLTGRYLLEGAAGLPALVGDAANSLINAGISGAEYVSGAELPKLQKVSGIVQSGLNKVGFPQPQTTTERIVSFPSRAMAGAMAMGGGAAASGSTTLAPLATNMPAQAGGAIGGGLAQGVTAEMTDNPWAQLAAGVGGGIVGGMVAGSRAPQPPAKTTQGVKQQAQDLYKQADNLGVVLTPAPVQRLQQQVTQDLADFGYHPQIHPRIAAVLDEITTLSGTAAGQLSVKNMQTLRRIAQNAANSVDDSERAIGSMIINRIDGVMTTLGPDDVLAGNADEASSLLSQAGSLWRDYKKASQIEKAFDKAQRAAASSGTGGNVDNAIRQKIKSILDSDSARRGFTKDEIDAMESIVRGTPTTSALRLLGRLSPQSGFLPTAFGLGAAAYGGPLAALPIMGAVAKPVADYATKRGVNDLINMILMGGQAPASSIPQRMQNMGLGLVPPTAAAPIGFMQIPPRKP